MKGLSDLFGIIFIMCSFNITVLDAYVMPPFTPNDYLFEKFSDGKKEKWEVYADAVRDVMCEQSGL